MHTLHFKGWAAILASALTLALATQVLALPAAEIDKADRAKDSKEFEACQAIVEELVARRAPIEPLGIVVANLHDFEGEEAQLVKQTLEMSDRLQILFIKPGSLAERLGLKVGDELIELNDHYVSRGESALEQFQDRVIARIDWSADVNATILRDGFGQTRSTKNGSKSATIAN